MKDLNAKLIISDFDGTLINSKQSVPQNVLDEIKEYIANGGIFAVITGRMLVSILPEVRKLGLKGLVAGYQGTMIADIESGKIIRQGGLNNEQSVEVCATLERLGAYVNAYEGENLYTDIPEDNKHLKLYESITGIKSKHVDVPLSQYVKNTGMCCQKVTSLCFPKDKLPLYYKLCAELGDRYDITYSADVLVEVSPKGDDKGAALEYLADYYKIPLSQTVAVGDNLNDLSMIIKAGVGVAVANATQPLKDKANYITTFSNDEGAIAEVIKKFGYK
jgi:hypothetical protein